MNPPSALQGAMGRERKPFTYTPGGLNLSEIKSERMAQRLMRNAMNEGVPQAPVQNIPSPTTPTTPLNVPNFNCLPVQVFPAFSLPPNPKSLLRSRSTPQQKDQPPAFHQQNSASTLPSSGTAKYRQNNDAQNQGVVNNGMNRGESLYTEVPRYINPATENEEPKQEKYCPYLFDTFKPCNDAVLMDARLDESQQSVPMYCSENQEPVTRRVVPPFQYNPTPSNYGGSGIDSKIEVDAQSKYSSFPSYINNSVTDMSSTPLKPSNLYEFNATANNSSHESYKTVESDGDEPKTSYCDFPSYINPPMKPTTTIENSDKKNKILAEDQEETKDSNLDSKNVKPLEVPSHIKEELNVYTDAISQTTYLESKPKNSVLSTYEQEPTFIANTKQTTEVEQNSSIDQTVGGVNGATDDKSEVKVVKKVKKETETQETKQAENNDSEAALTVTLPTKKSAAKTETKVEVKQKVLPDGSIEETKKTITKTTIDGRTEISTRTETRTYPKEEQEEEEVEEEEEEEEIDDGEVVIQEVKENGEPQKKITNGQATVVKKEERSETTTTKKVVVFQDDVKGGEDEEEEELEEEEEEIKESVEVKPKPPTSKPPPKPVEAESEEEVEEEEEEATVDQTVQLKNSQVVTEIEVKNEEKSDEVITKVIENEEKLRDLKKEQEVEEEEDEEYEEAEEKAVEEEVKVDARPELETKPKTTQEEEDEYTEEEVESADESPKEASIVVSSEPKNPTPEEPEIEAKPETKQERVQTPVPEPQKESTKPPKPIDIPIHFDKVDDIEIKPIGPQESITKTEKTEITTSKDCDGSTKTEMHRIENVVVSNRITKTLDQSYEQLAQGLPTLKTYFAPSRERVEISPAKTYQPTYQQPEPTTERRHSLLLERLSMERQLPTQTQYQNQTYQSYNNNQTHETQRAWSQEPQSEVVNISNVKPSTITKNQQWYQNTNENAIYNNVSQTPAPQQWSQPSPQPHYQPPPPPQPQYQPPPPPQPQFQVPAQPIYQTQYQPPQPPPAQNYTDTYSQNYSKDTKNSYQQSSYPSYTPQPASWGSNNVDNTINTNQHTHQNDIKSSPPQYSSTYVPPPWEQDSSYIAPPTNTSYFQPPPSTNEFQSNSSVPGWKPATPTTGKFSKPAPKAYVPPAPNQSFVKPVAASEPPRNTPGRKTYYSEYERRYISVPETTYVPGESKYQPQPNPSPQYYYDNDETQEKVEPEWRRELREFTEKTSQTYSTDKGTQSQYQSQAQTQYQTDQGIQSQYQSQYQTESSARPPWEQDTQYAKTPSVPYTPTPTWSQTLRPNSGRERTFESDYVSQNTTLGRRPMSFVEKSSNPLPGRPRGVSVDRYNPASYRSPIPTEHSPVQSHTLNPATAPPHKIYNSPSVPTYHSRASAEPREQPAPYPQSRHIAERTSPLQSRSFKYLQWITGTDE